MATRSRIGIQLSDDSILSVYHHWDGYPQWLGRILKTHYNTKEKVAELIDGGDMSSAWTNERWGGVNEYGGQMKKRLKNMVLSITLSVVRIALLVMIKTWKSFSLLVKNTLTSFAMVSG